MGGRGGAGLARQHGDVHRVRVPVPLASPRPWLRRGPAIKQIRTAALPLWLMKGGLGAKRAEGECPHLLAHLQKPGRGSGALW